jgi:hypothetical protein
MRLPGQHLVLKRFFNEACRNYFCSLKGHPVNLNLISAFSDSTDLILVFKKMFTYWSRTFKVNLHKKLAALKNNKHKPGLSFNLFDILFALDAPSQTFLGSIYHLEKHTEQSHKKMNSLDNTRDHLSYNTKFFLQCIRPFCASYNALFCSIFF